VLYYLGNGSRSLLGPDEGILVISCWCARGFKMNLSRRLTDPTGIREVDISGLVILVCGRSPTIISG
jgi:hypothetical protein